MFKSNPVKKWEKAIGETSDETRGQFMRVVCERGDVSVNVWKLGTGRNVKQKSAGGDVEYISDLGEGGKAISTASPGYQQSRITRAGGM